MDVLKNIRVYIILVLVLLSVYLIFSPYVFKKGGAVVSFLDQNNKCSNIKVGSTINQVNGAVISDSQSYDDKTKGVIAGTYVPMVVNGGPAGCVALRDGYLGLDVSDASGPQIKFSPEIGKSILTVFKVDDSSTAKGFANIIKERIAILKLVGYSVATEGDTIKITSLDRDISQLTKTCDFEIDIDRTSNLPTTNSSFVILDGKKYAAEIADSKIILNGTEYSLNKYFYVDHIKTTIGTAGNSTLTISQIFVNGSDARIAGLQTLQYYQQIGGFRLQVPISISPEAFSRFGKIVAGLKPIYSGGISIVPANFVYKLDNETISEIPIPSEIANENFTTISIIGFNKNLNVLEGVWSNLQICLNSGPLNGNIEKISTQTIEPSKKSLAELTITGFLISSMIISFILIQLRYKVPKYWYALAGLVLAELFIVFGFIVAMQKYAVFLIDFVTVVGFAVFGAISIGQMIFGMEYLTRNKEMSLSYRLKKFGRLNFLINLSIFVAAIVLMFFAQGFGFALLFGVMVGTLTKSVFFKMLTKLQP